MARFLLVLRLFFQYSPLFFSGFMFAMETSICNTVGSSMHLLTKVAQSMRSYEEHVKERLDKQMELVRAGQVKATDLNLNPIACEPFMFTAIKHGTLEDIQKITALEDGFWLAMQEAKGGCWNAVEKAVEENRFEIVEYLCGVLKRELAKLPTEHSSEAAKEEDIVKFLFNNGARLADGSLLRNGVLHWAVKNKNPHMVQFLLENGANPQLTNFSKETPEDLLKSFEEKDIASELKALFSQWRPC